MGTVPRTAGGDTAVFSDEQVVAIMAAIIANTRWAYPNELAAEYAQNLFDAVRAERAKRFTYRPDDEAKE